MGIIGQTARYRIGKEEDLEWIAMFRNNLKHILKTRNSNLKEVSDKLGISIHKLSSYINGPVRLEDGLVRQIADVVGCTVDELLDETYCPWNYGLTKEEIARNGRRFK